MSESSFSGGVSLSPEPRTMSAEPQSGSPEAQPTPSSAQSPSLAAQATTSEGGPASPLTQPPTPGEHVFRLSSIDQSMIRVYIRYALCFPLDNSESDAVCTRFNAAVKRVITHLPILAGFLRPATLEEDAERGKLEVAVTRDAVTNFKPTIKHLSVGDYPHTYEDLAKARMPPSTLVCDELTPLPDIPDTLRSPVFAVQASFISNGLIIAFYLHHSVADGTGLRTIISHFSSALPTRNLTEADLRDEALEQSRLRDRLSGSRGRRADTVANMRPADADVRSAGQLLREMSLAGNSTRSRIISFNLKLLQEMKDLLNERIHYIHNDRSVSLSSFDTIAAVLWKGINRARMRTDQYDQDGPLQTSTVIIPTNVRKRVEPPLDDSYLGNAVVHGLATSAMVVLAMPYDAGDLAITARMVRNATATIGEDRVRSAIAGINESRDVQAAPIKRGSLDTDVVITSWADLLLEEADLNLGIGKPAWGRKLGRSNTAAGCIVHAMKREEGLWEVMVQLKGPVMEKLLTDDAFRSFVVHVA